MAVVLILLGGWGAPPSAVLPPVCQDHNRISVIVLLDAFIFHTFCKLPEIHLLGERQGIKFQINQSIFIDSAWYLDSGKSSIT